MNTKYQEIIQKLGKGRVLLDEPLAKYTTFKIGGPADLFFEAKTEKELVKAVDLAKNLKAPYFILGQGSNVLVADKGFRGLTIKMGIESLEIKNDKVVVGAGLSLSKLTNLLIENSLTGLEFMAGIPGSVGGAVVGNAGAWQKNIGDRVVRVKVLNPEGETKWLGVKQSGFEYRSSRFKKGSEIVLLVELKLEKGDRQKIKKEIESNLAKRTSQPKEPSAGCVFVNPKPQSAGALIEKAGLKGARIGGAQVSPEHANFIVNIGGARASDVLALSRLIKEKVKQEFGIDLKEEIVKIGEF
ncbi:MAG TPA: UDP-N-acetylmuramate dehydrogenase [Clostridia bacterium]|nr:UDP-N-acetylmuramate dehydrogenase [Clostridia bacterium]